MRYGLMVTLVALAAAPATAEPIHFLVAEPPGREQHRDSYVVSLNEAQDIAHARGLIAGGPDIGGAIVLARIAAGPDGINRDYRAPGAPPWSWHVTEFLGFTDFSPEIYDGWPKFVEQDVERWINNTQGTIGFWNYTIVAELPQTSPQPVAEPSSALVLGIGVMVLAGYVWRRRGLAPGVIACRSAG
jgi:hypothetical protein